tara:strand:- start:545 stop:682 length:138 start_codon:yes stop_codon:yes gene_type:complete
MREEFKKITELETENTKLKEKIKDLETQIYFLSRNNYMEKTLGEK